MEEQLREGLRRLDSYVKELDFQSTLLEKVRSFRWTAC